MNALKTSKLSYRAVFASLAVIVSIVMVAEFYSLKPVSATTPERTAGVSLDSTLSLNTRDWQLLVKSL
jgi:hypothetical membrane protein